MVSLAFRYRRAGTAERAQLKWLVYAGAVIVVAALASVPVSSNLQNAISSGAIALVPVAIGIAVMRYRLYDIDRVISRTVAYAIVTGLLAGVYAGLVLLATQVLRLHAPVAVAAATLAAAALFTPVRWRVQRVVDRRFNRARYDGDRMVEQFAAGLKDAVDLDAVRADLAGVVQPGPGTRPRLGVGKRSRVTLGLPVRCRSLCSCHPPGSLGADAGLRHGVGEPGGQAAIGIDTGHASQAMGAVPPPQRGM